MSFRNLPYILLLYVSLFLVYFITSYKSSVKQPEVSAYETQVEMAKKAYYESANGERKTQLLLYSN